MADLLSSLRAASRWVDGWLHEYDPSAAFVAGLATILAVAFGLGIALFGIRFQRWRALPMLVFFAGWVARMLWEIPSFLPALRLEYAVQKGTAFGATMFALFLASVLWNKWQMRRRTEDEALALAGQVLREERVQVHEEALSIAGQAIRREEEHG